jgi:hypothetical protein
MLSYADIFSDINLIILDPDLQRHAQAFLPPGHHTHDLVHGILLLEAVKDI